MQPYIPVGGDKRMFHLSLSTGHLARRQETPPWLDILGFNVQSLGKERPMIRKSIDYR